MYNWENSKSKTKSNSSSKHKHLHHQYDSKNPTCSSSFLNKFNKSIKTHYPKSHQNEDLCLTTSSSSTTTPRNRASSTAITPRNKASSTTTTPRNRGSSTTAISKDEKMSSLRRACLVEKWMEKKVNDKVIAKAERNSSSSSTTLLEEFDLQDALFFSSATTTSSSSSSDEIEYSVFSQPKQKPRVTCFAPSRPKPIKTRTVESTFIDHFGEENDEDFMKNRSKAASFYSNLKNLKQPISPGIRLTTFINSLFTKDGKSKKKSSSTAKQRKTEESAYSSCSSASTFSRSCLNKNNKKFQDDGSKRTVRFCPVSVIVDDDSQACGYKILREEKVGNHDSLLNSKFGRSLSKRYEELKKLRDLEIESDRLQQKKLEEVALDLLSGYWDSRLNKSHDLSSKEKGNDDNYGDNHGVNYVKHEVEVEVEVEDGEDDGFSCSSSDLFELDHLSLIGDELPVYETTKFNSSNIM